jgi:hypothetical protein
MTWSELDWSVLDRLRERFLHRPASGGAYWESPEDLANYDLTYGERIGWKWDQVLRELRMRGWRPRSREVFDWGCGSGIAARRVMAFFGADSFESLAVWDHSPLACDYAGSAASASFPNVRVTAVTPGFLASDAPIGLLVLSHVLNELTPAQIEDLLRVVRRSESVLWVEPGTHETSRQLGRIRDALRDSFHIVAPCTHELGCPMFAAGNERHWCHFFAPPPAEIFADSQWVKFGQRAGIDLRSLPYAFVAADRRGGTPPATSPPDTTLSRVIGRVETFKPYARVLNCDATGLNDLELPKRAAPLLFKELDRTKAPLVYRWQREGNKIAGGTAISPTPATSSDGVP